jgi:superfamily II DNA helicase RecQ
MLQKIGNGMLLIIPQAPAQYLMKIQDIVVGTYQIVVVSPEMLQSCRFVEKVLCKPEFGPCVLSVFIDKAHCVLHWGASFHKKYATIGMVCTFLPCSTPMIAVTATLTLKVH